MKILVLNIGSTSFRFKLYDINRLDLIASGKMENLSTENLSLIHI